MKILEKIDDFIFWEISEEHLRDLFLSIKKSFPHFSRKQSLWIKYNVLVFKNYFLSRDFSFEDFWKIQQKAYYPDNINYLKYFMKGICESSFKEIFW
jgi:hypothetical protein